MNLHQPRQSGSVAAAALPSSSALRRAMLLVFAVALLLGVLPATSAAAAPPVPPAPLPPDLDIVDVYQGQVLCDPTPKPGTLKLRDLLWATYGSGIWAGLSRDCDVSWDRGISEHKDGRAIDWGVTVRNGTKAQGDEFVTWATANNGANARRLGIMYLIWDSKMWRLYDMGRGWSEYNQCLSTYTSTSYDTSCHRDHVHISMTWHGAAAWTSWYDGTPVWQEGCDAGSPIPAPAGTSQRAEVLFDPLAGVGVTGGRPCFLDGSIQTVQVPVLGSTRETIQRLRVEHTQTNAPSSVKLWSSVGGPVLLGQSDSFPREIDLPIGSDGRIYFQEPIGQAGIRVLGVGQQHLLRAGEVLEVPAAGGATGVPADARAVSLNVTVTAPQSAGFLTVFPCGVARPVASVLNYAPGETVANATVIAPGAGGSVCVFTSSTAHVVVDATGFHPAGSPFTPTSPTRLLDTRSGARPAASTEIAVKVPDGAAAASLSIAVTEPDARGWVTVYPCGSTPPPTSSVNFEAGTTKAGSVTVGVGANGTVCLRSPVSTHMIVDLMGTMSSNPGYAQLVPQRLTDTRLAPGGMLPPDTELAVAVPLAAKATNVTLTVTNPQGRGWITPYACGTTPPSTSALNFVPGQTIANSATIAVGANGMICLRSSAATNVIVDLTGAYLPGSQYATISPRRLADTRLS